MVYLMIAHLFWRFDPASQRTTSKDMKWKDAAFPVTWKVLKLVSCRAKRVSKVARRGLGCPSVRLDVPIRITWSVLDVQIYFDFVVGR